MSVWTALLSSQWFVDNTQPHFPKQLEQIQNFEYREFSLEL